MMTNPLTKDLPILVSFSGGRTSALMARMLKEYFGKKRACYFVTCNTGMEGQPFYDFVDLCDRQWGLDLVWLEADIQPETGTGTRFRKVTYHTANRDGKPFEDMIRKYGIPSMAYRHCTRELKQVVMKKYMQSLGYADWVSAVGIRADERHRLSSGSKLYRNPWYPLAGGLVEATEADIRRYWERQPFDLGWYIPRHEAEQVRFHHWNTRWKGSWFEHSPNRLDSATHLFVPQDDYEGNCTLCYKKSLRNKLTMQRKHPGSESWWIAMEETYTDGMNQTHFNRREGQDMTMTDLQQLSRQPFRLALDRHRVRSRSPALPAISDEFDPVWDTQFDCLCKA